jgi:hypothetical protein
MKARLILFCGLGLLVGAAAPPCTRVADFHRVFRPPDRLRAIAAGKPVAVAPGEVVAEEMVHMAAAGWMLAEPLTLRWGGKRHVYPAGEPVWLVSTPDGILKCLLPAAISGRGAGAKFGLVVCLGDPAPDRRYHSILLQGPGAGSTRFPLEGSTALGAALEAGVEDYDAHRRIRIASVDGDRVGLTVEYAIDAGGGPGRFVVDEAGERSVELRAGETVTAGGLRFRAERSGEGWTLTPLDGAFPAWLRIDCNGDVHLGEE